MQFAQLGAVAALASVSQAFLIPPEISSADIDSIKILPFEDAVAMDGRVVEIACPGCPVSTEFKGKTHSVQADSTLQLNFSVSHENGADQLLLNGLQVYPIDPTSQTFMEPLTAPQMFKADDETWHSASIPKLGYSVGVKRPATMTKDNMDLVAIHLEIVEVAGKFLKGIPTVDIKLLELPTGKLIIGGTEVHRPTTLSNPTDSGRECTTLVCKWRAIVADRLEALKKGSANRLEALKKGCGAKRPHPEVRPVFIPRPHHMRPHSQHPEAHVRPQHHGGHRPWRHHHRHGSFGRFLRGIVFHVMVPVLVGVMVGITASLVGMVVGHIVIGIWRLLFRRGQPKYAEVKQEEVEDIDVKQGPPPQYTDAVDEKKEVE